MCVAGSWDAAAVKVCEQQPVSKVRCLRMQNCGRIMPTACHSGVETKEAAWRNCDQAWSPKWWLSWRPHSGSRRWCHATSRKNSGTGSSTARKGLWFWQLWSGPACHYHHPHQRSPAAGELVGSRPIRHPWFKSTKTSWPRICSWSQAELHLVSAAWQWFKTQQQGVFGAQSGRTSFFLLLFPQVLCISIVFSYLSDLSSQCYVCVLYVWSEGVHMMVPEHVKQFPSE